MTEDTLKDRIEAMVLAFNDHSPFVWGVQYDLTTDSFRLICSGANVALIPAQHAEAFLRTLRRGAATNAPPDTPTTGNIVRLLMKMADEAITKATTLKTGTYTRARYMGKHDALIRAVERIEEL